MKNIEVAIGAFIILSMCFWKLYKKEYAIAIFNGVWGSILIISIGWIAENMQNFSWLLIFTMIFFVNIGYLIGKYKIVLNKKEKKEKKEIMTVECNWFLVKNLLILSMIIITIYFSLTIMRYGINLNLIRASYNSGNEDAVFNGLFDTLIFYGFAVPMIYVVALIIAYNISQKKRIPRSVLICLILDIIVYTFTTGGRSLMIRIVIFICAAFLWRIHRFGRKNINLWYWVIAGIALYIILNLMTLLRNSKDISFLAQTIMYIRGALLHMDHQIINEVTDKLYFGYITYGGFFYYPVKLVKTILGFNINTSNEIMAFLQTYKMLYIGKNEVMYYNALIPNVYYYYFDMGYVGVILFSFILGYAARYSENSYKKPGFLRFVMWATVIYAVLYSCFGGILWSFSYPTALIYCFILKRYVFKKR